MFMLLTSMPLMGMPGLMEWVLIGLAVVLLFGASKLPKLGKGLGEGIRNFKSGLKGETETPTDKENESTIQKEEN